MARILRYSAIKRGCDILMALSGMMLLSPFIMVIAVLVRINLGGAVLFRQTRPGMHGKPFTLIKFRTMRDRHNEQGETLPDSARLTSFGRSLRKTSMDELPELWNVIKGDMSIVGPRPLLMEYLPLYTSEQARRHEVKPGITGWAQVNGRNAISWEDKFKLDVWYVEHQSCALDFKIIVKTVLDVLLTRGITQPGSVTMEKFRGTSVK